MGLFSRNKEELHTATAPIEPVEQRASLADLLSQMGWVKGSESIISVSEHSALSIPAFWRAVSLKAGLVATFPLYAYDASGKLEQQPLLLEQPDPTEDFTTTVIQLVTSLILCGNAFAILGYFDSLGYPRVIKPVHPEKQNVGWRSRSR